MRCFNRQTQNPHGAKFCFNCGAPHAGRVSELWNTTELPGEVLPQLRSHGWCAPPCPSIAACSSYCRDSPSSIASQVASQASPSTPNLTSLEPAASEADARLQQYIPRELLGKLQAARGKPQHGG